MGEILIFGSFWFWSFIALIIIYVFALIEHYENAVAPVVVLIIAAVALKFFGTVNIFKDIFDYALNSPVSFLLYIVLYFVCGTLYGIYRWYKFCLWTYEMYRSSTTDMQVHKPKIEKHVEDFIRWASYWPISIVWSIINDPITKVFRWAAKRLQSILNSISDRIFNKIISK